MSHFGIFNKRILNISYICDNRYILLNCIETQAILYDTFYNYIHTFLKFLISLVVLPIHLFKL